MIHGAARREEKRKTIEQIHGFSEGRHAKVWCDTRRKKVRGRQMMR